MKKLLTILLTFFVLTSNAQEISKRISKVNKKYFAETKVFQKPLGHPFGAHLLNTLSKYELLDIVKSKGKPKKYIRTTIGQFTVLLHDTLGHYEGIIEGDNSSLVSLSHTYEGFISNKDGNWVVAKMSKAYILYSDKDFIKNPVAFECGTQLKLPIRPKFSAKATSPTTTKVVGVQWEIANDVVISLGSVQAARNWAMTVFGMYQTFYANEGIHVKLDTLIIWATKDPYITSTSANGSYGNYISVNNPIFADITKLISFSGGQGGYSSTGGITYACGNAPNMVRRSYCGVVSAYNGIPIYSWTLENIIHEDGHLFGSPHTQDCFWNGNNTRIDNCGGHAGYPSGTCADIPDPVIGGTIMSYCHLRPCGINFSLGLGQQVRDLMINTINAVPCLGVWNSNPPPPPPPSCCIPDQPGAITGNSNVNANTTQVYSVPVLPCTIGYSWTLPNGAIGSSSTNSITVLMGAVSGTISVIGLNDCGSGISRTLSVNVNPVPPPIGTCICPTQYCHKIIVDSIQQQSDRIVVRQHGGTSYKYSWKKNGVQQSWTGQSIGRQFLKRGDYVEVVVGSTSSQTSKYCWVHGNGHTTIWKNW